VSPFLALSTEVVFVAGLALAGLLAGVIYLAMRLRTYRERLDLEAEKARRLRAQLKAMADLHPDRQPVVERSDAEWASKFDQLRRTYNKLFARHKALVKEYQRLHRYVERAKAASAASDGAADPHPPPATPRPSPQQTTSP
jgi:biopolymer transport protein ExbB/TolQ